SAIEFDDRVRHGVIRFGPAISDIVKPGSQSLDNRGGVAFLSPRILIIGRDRHLRQALEQQLTRRGRSWHSVAPGAELGAAFKSMGHGDRVVDLASYEAAIHGAGRGWDDAGFEELVQLSLQH